MRTNSYEQIPWKSAKTTTKFEKSNVLAFLTLKTPKNHAKAVRKHVNLVDLVKSFPTSIYYLLAKIGVDTAEHEPSEVWSACPRPPFEVQAAKGTSRTSSWERSSTAFSSASQCRRRRSKRLAQRRRKRTRCPLWSSNGRCSFKNPACSLLKNKKVVRNSQLQLYSKLPAILNFAFGETRRFEALWETNLEGRGDPPKFCEFLWKFWGDLRGCIEADSCE